MLKSPEAPARQLQRWHKKLQTASTDTNTHTHWQRAYIQTAERWLYVAKSSRAAASGAFIFINPFLGTVCQLATQLQLPAPAARCSMLPLTLLLSALCSTLLLLLSLPAAAAADVSLSQISDAAVAAVCSLCLFYLPLHANAYIYHTHIYTIYLCVLRHCCCWYAGLSLRQVCRVTINCFVFNFVWMWGARLWLRLLINKGRQSRKEKRVQ